jgi:hypothetical protein
MANKAAKNMSSLASHTIVPTATALGRVIFWCATVLDIGAIIPEIRLGVSPASPQGVEFERICGETDHYKSAGSSAKN